jgi:hypothetical protein
MIQRNNDFATQALKTLGNGALEQPPTKRVICTSNADNQRSGPLKRSRSSLSGSFDMGEFLKASEQVEETIKFPAIEWPSVDDDDESTSTSSSDIENNYSVKESFDEEEEDDEDFCEHRRKRQCRGLTRCRKSCNLTSLWEIANSQRRGSSGSLS